MKEMQEILQQAAADRVFPDQVQSVVFHTVHERGNQNFRVPQTKSFDLAKDEVSFIANLEHWREMMEMLFCSLSLPSGALHKAADELLLPADEVDHSALVVTNERYAVHITDSDGVRYFEFAVPQICTAGPYDERKIVGDVKMLSIVHAHSDEQLRSCVDFMRAIKVMVFEQQPDRGSTVLRRNVALRGYRQKFIHLEATLLSVQRLQCRRRHLVERQRQRYDYHRFLLVQPQTAGVDPS